eukprot:11588865-Karenia_brevis.AAC.1
MSLSSSRSYLDSTDISDDPGTLIYNCDVTDLMRKTFALRQTDLLAVQTRVPALLRQKLH